MIKLILKKLSLFTVLLVLILFIAHASVRAEDDEEEDDEEEYSSQNQTSVIQEASAGTESKTVTTTKVETLKDSDGDGLLDKDDPHPKIPEIYIVEDDNANGIVDKFEKRAE